MFGIGRRIKDGTGEDAPVLLVGDLPPGASELLRTTVRQSQVGTFRAATAYSALLAGVWTGMFWLGWGVRDIRLLGSFAFFFLVILAIRLVRLPRGSVGRWNDVIPACLAVGLCPSCGYKLDGPTDNQGLKLCTECGHKWAAPDVPKSSATGTQECVTPITTLHVRDEPERM